MTTLDADVVVVGAGPVGLMLAGELRLGGADVVVLEQRETPTTESRASTLHARTMEILDSRGLLTPLGTPPNEPRGHFGGLPFDLTLPGAYPGQWKVPQTRTEELLQEWALLLGAQILRGHRVRELIVAGDHVRVDADARRVRARYVVGCDGENSTVRALLGAAFPGADAERELLRADVAGIDVPNRRFQRLPRGLAVAARRGDGVTRVMVHEFGSVPRFHGKEPDFAAVAQTWRRVTGEDISGGTPIWVNSFGDANRQLARYRHGRVLLAGDAAHQQMPIGGQALNLGLQDAVNLGWKLAHRLRDAAAEDLLDSYHAERHAVGRRVLANITAQAMLLLGGPEVESLRAVVGELVGIEPVRRHLAGMISGLDVRYGAGARDHPLLGARLPTVALTTGTGTGVTTTAALLRGGRGVLLDLAGSSPRVPAAAGGWARQVPVVSARPADAPAGDMPAGDVLAGVRALLVRPDGHVAWVDTRDG